VKNTERLWFSIIAVALVVLAMAVILSRLARARAGSWATADVKLAACTNSLLNIRITQMPALRRIDLVLGVPEELTNTIEHVSGSLGASGGLTVTGATTGKFAIRAINPESPLSIIAHSEEPLIAYFLGSIEGAPSRFHAAEIVVSFSNAPPRGVSLWARYRYDRYHPVHVK
jgi:hypothetical protein